LTYSLHELLSCFWHFNIDADEDSTHHTGSPLISLWFHFPRSGRIALGQILINGLINGLTLAVLALGFTVVYLPTRVFYVALGGVYSLAPFIVWAGLRQGLPWYFGTGIALTVGIIVSMLCEFTNHARLEKRGSSISGSHLVSSLGIYIVLVQFITLIWGNDTKVLRSGLDQVIHLGGLLVTHAQIIAASVAIAVLGIFYVWLQRSQLGLQFRALADNPKEFAIRGYNVRWLRLLAFGLAGALGTISSLLVNYEIGFNPEGGLAALLLAVVAMIVGGQQSFYGPVLGGVLLGLLRSLVVWSLSAKWQEAVTFLILVICLFVRPYGLLGQANRLEAEE
jgi:branched-chain amino acid transport system permease protein